MSILRNFFSLRKDLSSPIFNNIPKYFSSNTNLFNLLEDDDLPYRPAYLDNQATTPLDPRVLDKIMPFFVEQYGNPHSRSHFYGWETKNAVKEARVNVQQMIGAKSDKSIIFTSGATESNNLALKGIAKFYGESRGKHIITTQIEHSCVLNTCRYLEQNGYRVTYLPVQKNGVIDMKEFENSISDDTSLVSIMAVNNEIGSVQPLKEIGEICRKRKIFFHTDAAQAVGKIPIDVEDMKIDLMSISGHKIYGPKGIGAIYVGRRPRVRLEALIHGGGQERGIRSGTLPAPLIVGIGEAARLAIQEKDRDYKWVKYLSDKIINGIQSKIPEVIHNGDPENGYPGCLNLSFSYVEGESLLMSIKQIAVSSGSACTSASLEPSYVLRALGVPEHLGHSSLRFGIGRFTTEEEVDFLIERTVTEMKRLRHMSPLWRLVQKGVDLEKIKWKS